MRPLLALLTLLATNALAQSTDPRYVPLRRPSSTWSPAELAFGLAHWDSIYPARVVQRGNHVHPLELGAPIATFAPGTIGARWLDTYLADERVAGIIVLQNGRIRLERYALGHSRAGRWMSQSVAKSITSTLVGAAVKDGFIRSIDEPVTTYIAGLRGSAYDSVTIRQLLTMTSGVRWIESYTDSASDQQRYYLEVPPAGIGRTVSYMRKLPREAPAGTKWVYKTGETHLLGVLVREATRRPLAQYLSEKIWQPYGMEQDAAWQIDDTGEELAGCCLMMSLRDYARFGQFILDGARIDGRSIVPDGWIEVATSRQVATDTPGRGYGYQWWTWDSGGFAGIGIFGQLIHIDPARRLVVAVNSAWPVATGKEHADARAAMLRQISAAIDADSRR